MLGQFDVGDKIMMQVKIIEVIEKAEGTVYKVKAPKGNDWQYLEVRESDIKQIICNRCMA
jgi:hypothetical protein